MNAKSSLPLYVVGVIIALAIVNLIAWRVGGAARLHAMLIFAAGFLAGMTSMYIKTRIMRR